MNQLYRSIARPHAQVRSDLEISSDAGRPEGMVSNLRLDASCLRALLDDTVGALLVQGFFREDAWPAHCRSKQIAVGVSGDTGRCDILVQEVIQIVVTGNVMLFSALLINIAKRMAGHSNVKTTELYDRRGDEVSFSEIERVGI
jgi:hypothetical protein